MRCASLIVRGRGHLPYESTGKRAADFCGPTVHFLCSKNDHYQDRPGTNIWKTYYKKVLFSYSGLTPTAAAWEVGSGAGAAAAAAGAKTVLCCLLFSALSNTDNREVRTTVSFEPAGGTTKQGEAAALAPRMDLFHAALAPRMDLISSAYRCRRKAG